MAGYYVYIPDFLGGTKEPPCGTNSHANRIFLGDALDSSILPKLAPTKQQVEGKTQGELDANLGEAFSTMGPWLAKHAVETTYPHIQKFLSHLRADPAHKKIGAVGFCWGGKFTVLLTHQDANPSVDAAVAFHPSLLNLPEDIEKIARPTSIGIGDADFVLPMSDIEKIQEIFKGKEGCEVDVYPDQVHGFAVRGDLALESDKKAAAKATERVISHLCSSTEFRHFRLSRSSRSICPSYESLLDVAECLRKIMFIVSIKYYPKFMQKILCTPLHSNALKTFILYFTS